jgi:hypothetical protein
MRWLKPGVDFSKYNRLILDRWVFLRTEFGIQRHGCAGIEESIRCLPSAYGRLGQEEMPHCGGTRARRSSHPLCHPGSKAEPSCDDSQNRYFQSWSVSGATCAELMLFGSMTNDVIAAAKDERKPGLKEKFTNWGYAEDALQFWAEGLTMILDQAHGLKT